MNQSDKTIQLEVRNIPKSYQLCFNSECPKREECLRHMAGTVVPEDRDWGPAIYPNIKINENGCRLFDKGEPKLMAWGFEGLLSEVKYKDMKTLRNTLKQYLGGHSNYYRYHSGERLLDTEQQNWILDLFRRMGYTKNLQFDHQIMAFVFH